ncbi:MULTISPECIES: hypothetical protein [unclassified Methylobacterium]|uniref:hypothetical protein n=1 Tax=unclassified Methylobacterium TaxID=2615210 RepID=UPI00226A0942|nr:MULTISPECIES: hypothetical protein [unclassified Methylobacterium]
MNVVTVKPKLTVYTPSRAMEWQGAAVSLVFAVILVLGPVFDTGTQWNRFAEIGTEREWGFGIGCVAALRLLALMINGRDRRTPALRAATALLGAGLWAFVAALFIVPGEPLTTGVGVYAVLSCSDLVSAWRAAKDAAIAKWIWGKAMAQNPPAPSYWEPAP